MLALERRGQERVYWPKGLVALKLILRGKRFVFSMAECRGVIDLRDPFGGNRKRLETFSPKVQAHCAQLEQQLLDIPQALDCSAFRLPPRSGDSARSVRAVAHAMDAA